MTNAASLRTIRRRYMLGNVLALGLAEVAVEAVRHSTATLEMRGAIVVGAFGAGIVLALINHCIHGRTLRRVDDALPRTRSSIGTLDGLIDALWAESGPISEFSSSGNSDLWLALVVNLRIASEDGTDLPADVAKRLARLIRFAAVWDTNAVAE